MAMAATYRFIPKQTALVVYINSPMNATGFLKFFCFFHPQSAIAPHSQPFNMNTPPGVSILPFIPHAASKTKPPSHPYFFSFILI
jgi:hypothetical protein